MNCDRFFRMYIFFSYFGEYLDFYLKEYYYIIENILTKLSNPKLVLCKEKPAVRYDHKNGRQS